MTKTYLVFWIKSDIENFIFFKLISAPDNFCIEYTVTVSKLRKVIFFKTNNDLMCKSFLIDIKSLTLKVDFKLFKPSGMQIYKEQQSKNATFCYYVWYYYK